jgi:predicted NAD/FAD-dependent oxidoreductase
VCSSDLAVLLHTRRAWSEARADSPAEEVLGELSALVSSHFGPILHAEVHRWRFGLPAGSSGELYRYDRASGLGLAGDGFPGAGVEGAWLSGRALADEVLEG